MRIVSLVPSLTELLFQLGVGHALVGRTRFCVEPPDGVQAIETVGGTKDPDVARVLALAPDLVVANLDENKPEHVAQMREKGLRVLHTDTDDLDRVERTMAEIGDAVEKKLEAARMLATIRRAREAAEAWRPDPPITAVIPVWRKPLICVGPHTYMEDLFAACGFRNLVAGGTKWPTLEAIDQFGTPDVVLLPTEPFRWREGHRGLWEKEGIPRERVRVVDGQLATWFASRTAEAIPHFAAMARELTGRDA